MIGKKINQLATELAPQSTDLTIIGDPISGVSKKITLAQLGAIFSGAVSFYNDLASFPVTGDINVIYCAKDTQKLYLWSGSAYVEVFPSQALLDTYQVRSEKGNANGYASLDSQGKVPISQLPSSIMEYKGTWNASTNTPTLANGTGDTGDVYICNVAGTVNFGAGPITFAVGDYVIYSGTIWQRSSGAVGTVTSVAASITGDSITISGSPVTTSGTLAFAFAGTGAQYIKGDGTLATFPTTIDQAKNLITEIYNNTGATLTKGTIVYITGGQGNLPTVSKALATSDATSAQTYGVVQSDITNMNNGFVVVAGRLSDIDTQAYANGTQLYLSPTTAGTWTSTKPTAPNHMVYVGIIVRSHPTQGVVEIKIQNGLELIELADVSALTPSNNDGLFYESSTSLWKNKSIATVLGYTPANAATYVPYTGATANVDLGAFDLLSRSAYLEGTASYQAGLLIKQRGLYNFVTGAYTQIVADSATDLNIVHNQANTTRRRYALSVAALQDGDSFQYLLPRANGTIALTSDLTGGTVTSVAALTIGTSGTDLSSTVANGTTTPVITLNVPTASATNRGALSSADWTTFNNKQNALTNPVTGTGTTNYLPKFTGTSAIGNSLVYDDGTNVGIGTTAANTLLSLVGNHAGSQSILKIQSSTAYSSSGLSSIGFNDSDGSRKAIIYTNTNGLQLETGTATSIIFNPNGTTALTLANGGAATFSNDLTMAGTLYLSGNNNYLRGRNAANTAYIAAIGINTSNKVQIDPDNNGTTFGGNVGIGTTSPSRKLHVYGTSTVFEGILVENSNSNAYSLYQSKTANSSLWQWGTWNDNSYRTGISGVGDFITITSGGNVGIGTTSPSYPLSVTSGIGDYTAAIVNTNVSDNAGLLIKAGVNSGNSVLRLQKSNGTDLFLVNAAGNVGIGVTPSDWNTLTPLQIKNVAFAGYTSGTTHVLYAASNFYYGGSGGGDKYITNGAASLYSQAGGEHTWFSAPTNSSGAGAALTFTPRMSITSAGLISMGNTSVSNGTTFGGGGQVNRLKVESGNYTCLEINGSTSGGSLQFTYGTNAPNQVGALIGYNYASGTVNEMNITNLLNGAMTFGTNNGERMRITSDGAVLLHTTSLNSSIDGQMFGTGGDTYFTRNSGTVLALNRRSSDGTILDFRKNDSIVGSVSITGSATTYNTSSDYRLKQDLKDFNGLDLISKLKAYDYEWKADKSRSYGVIAHELQSVINYAVTGVKDGKEMQGVDYSKIVPVLIKAIQELNDKIK